MKKILLSLLAIMIIIFGGIFFSKKENSIDQNAVQASKKNLAFLICDGVGANCEESQSVPTGDYILDEERTYCEAGGKISNYDSTLGTIKYTIKGNDECKIYFKEQPRLEPTTKVWLQDDFSITNKDDDDDTYGVYDTQIAIPTDYDEIEYINFKELGASGIFNDSHGYFGFWNEHLTDDICEIYGFCYTVSSIYDVKLSIERDPSFWDFEPIYFNQGSTLQFNYLFDYDGYWGVRYAFRLKKNGYKPSAWYGGWIFWDIIS
ncbi:MAG: hypothetical protein E7164_01395 [Firmicutes bacterium]|nr:hypothetical protein [Bacillota bacterium]